VDNLMRTELRFQYARDRSPNAAGDDRRQNAEWDQQHRRQTRPRPIRHYRLPIDHRRYRHSAEFYPDPRRGERAHVKLAFRADVQKAAPKCDRHRQARKYKRCRVMQRPSDVLQRTERTRQKPSVRDERVIAHYQNYDAADNESRNDRSKRPYYFTKNIHPYNVPVSFETTRRMRSATRHSESSVSITEITAKCHTKKVFRRNIFARQNKT